MNKRINVIIAGTRTFRDYKLVCTVMKIIREKYPCIRIISGGAKGADKCGELYALEHKLPYMVYEADWKNQGKKAGPLRNLEMAKVSQVLVLFWDGESRGASNMLDEAIRLELDCYVMNYKMMKFYAGKNILDKIYDDIIPF